MINDEYWYDPQPPVLKIWPAPKPPPPIVRARLLTPLKDSLTREEPLVEFFWIPAEGIPPVPGERSGSHYSNVNIPRVPFRHRTSGRWVPLGNLLYKTAESERYSMNEKILAVILALSLLANLGMGLYIANDHLYGPGMP